MKFLFEFSDTSQTAPAEGWVISSESCGFLSIGARYEREVSFMNEATILN